MNKIYKVVFNKSTGTFTAVTEFAKAQGKTSSGTVGSTDIDSSHGFKLSVAVGAILAALATISATSTYAATQVTVSGVTAMSGGSQVYVETNSTRVAVGFETVANSGEWSTSVGSRANATGGSTSIGYAAISSQDSTAIGAMATAGYTVTRNTGSGAVTAATKSGNQAVALGYKATASGDQSLAIGGDTRALGGASIAIGGDDLDAVSKANLNGSAATALNGGNINTAFKAISGVDLVDTANQYPGTTSSGQGAVAIGVQAVSAGHLATAVGTTSNASGMAASALGVASQADGNGSIAIGPNAVTNSTGTEGVAIGARTRVTADSAVAIANGSTATGVNAVAIANTSSATANDAIAIGNSTDASALRAAALGANATASGMDSIAIGTNTTSSGQNANAMGLSANSSGTSSFAMGTRANASGESAYAIGTDAIANNTKSIAIGSESKSSEDKTIAIGDRANASGYHGISIGAAAAASGNTSMALGDQAIASSNYSFAAGGLANATANYATAIGANANATGEFSTALGKSATATGRMGTALGINTNATGPNATAVGSNATAMGSGGLAMGLNATAGSATFNNAISIGTNSSSVAHSSIATGTNATASANNAIATGTDSKAQQQGSIAIGQNATSANIHALALGTNATANLNRSVALGAYSTVSAAVDTNQATVGPLTYSGFVGSSPDDGDVVSVGSADRKRQIQNVAAGQITATSTDAINGSQLFATNTVLGNLATSVKNEFGGNAALQTNGTVTFSNIGNTGKDTIHDAIAAVKENVVAGSNVVVTPVTAANGSTTYTVHAKDTTASHAGASADFLTVTAQPQANNVTNYETALTTRATDALKKAETAVQNIASPDNSVVVNKVGDTTNLQIRRGLGITLDSNGGVAVANTTLVQGAETMRFSTPRGQQNSFVKADDLARHLNNTGFRLSGEPQGGTFEDLTADVGERQIRNGDTLTMIAGPNMKINQVNKGFEFSVEGVDVAYAGNKATVPADAESVATAKSVAEAINHAGFTLKTSAVTGGNKLGGSDEVINPADTVEMIAGKNLTVFQEGNGRITYATKDDVTFNTTTTNNLTVNPNGNVNMGGNTINNVGSGGDVNTNAANIGDVKKAKTEVEAGSNVNIASRTGDNGQTIYTVNAYNTTAASVSPDYISVAGKPATAANTTNYEIGLTDKAITDFTKDTQATVVSTDNTVTVKSTEKNANGTIVYDLSVNTSVPTTTLTTNKGNVETPAQPDSYVTAGNLATTINNAVASAKEKVEAGTNIASVESKVDDATGATTFTVNAKGTTASAGSDKVTVTPTEKAGNITDYAVDLSQAAKDSLNKADTAIQQFTTAVKGATVDTINQQNTVINFVDGVGTTATVKDSDITFDVNKADLTTDTAGNVTSNKAGDNFVTGDDVADAINKATELTEKTTTVVAGKNTHVQNKVDGNNTEYTVSADKSTVSVSSALTKTETPTTDATTGAVTTDYALDLSQTTKDDIKKGVDAKNIVDTEGLTFTGDSGTTSEKLLGSSVAVNGDNNITTEATADAINIKLNKDITVNSVTANTTTTNNLKVNPNGNVDMGDNQITNVASGGDVNTNAANIGDVKKAKTEVKAGTNIVDVVKTEGDNGQDIYTVNAKDTTATHAASSAEFLTVSDAQDKGNNVKNFETALTTRATDALKAAETAVQNFKVAVNGADVQTVANGDTVKFVNGTGTTARNASGQITFDINKSTLTTDAAGNVTNNTAGDTFVTGDDVAKAINEAAERTEKTTTVVKGSNTHVQAKEVGNNTEYTVSADKSTVSVSDALKMQATPTTDANEAVTTEYALDLSDKTKEDIKKGVDAKDIVDTKGLTFTGDNGTTTTEKLLGTSVAVNGDDNITTEATADAINIKLNKDINVDSVTANTVNVGPVTINNDGIDAGDTNIKNVADGVDDGDAVNVKQLKASREEVKSDDKSVTVTTTQNDAGANVYDLSVNVDETTITKTPDGKLTANTTNLVDEDNDGKVDAPQGDDAKKLVNAGDITNAINASGFKAKANGDEGELINPGDEVDFINGSNIEITREGGKFTVATKKDVTFDSVTFGDNGPKITNNGGNINVGGPNGEPVKITNVADGDVNADSKDAVNGSQLYTQVMASREEVKSDDKSVTVTTTQNDAGANVYDLSVNVDETTITKTPDGKLTANTTNLVDEDNDGKVDAPQGDDAKKLVNAGDITNAINASGFKAKANGDEGELINPGDEVDFINGSNIEITREGGKFTVATKKDVTFDSVTFGDNGPKITNNGGNINVGGPNGEPVKITNVADGDVNADSKDAVNGSQLYTQVAASKEVVKSDDKSVTVTTTQNDAGANVYDLSVNVDGTTITKGDNGELKANTTTLADADNDGKVDDLADDKKGNLITAGDITNAINASGFKAKANGDEGELINPGDEVDFINGSNIEITREGGKFTVATKKDVTFDSVTFGDNGPKITNNGGNINVGGPNGEPVKITNVADGDVNADSKDAVNGSQLYTQVMASREEVKSDDKSVTVTTTQNDAGANVYDLSVNVDETTITKTPDGKLTANTTNLVDEDNDGKVDAPQGDDAKKLVNAGDITNAINASGFKAKANGDEGELINPGDEVDFINGSNIEITREGGKFTVATKKDVTFDSVTFGDNGPKITNNGGNINVGGPNGEPVKITNVADGDVNADSKDAVNGSQLYTQVMASREEVKSDDKSVTVTTTQNDAGANVYDLSVNVDETTITKTPDGKLTANTTNLVDEDNDGKVDAPQGDDAKKLVNAGDITNAINASGFKAKANGDEGELINPGDEVDFINGSNIEITREGGKFTVATKKDVTFDSVTFGDNGPKITNNGGNINVGGPNGEPVKITNVADGDVNADSKDAVNGSQLYTQVAASKEVVKSDDKSVTVTTTQNDAGANVYDLSVNVDGTTITKGDNGELKANTTTLADADNDGKVDDLADDKKGNLITAGDITNAINASGFKAKANGDEGELINPGDEVDFINGSNIEITREGGKFTVATKKDVTFDSVTFGDNGPKITNNGGNINVGGPNGEPVKITNVADGDVNADSKDAVNGSQLYTQVMASREEVKSDDKSVTVTTTQNDAGANVYDLSVNVDETTITKTPDGKLTANTTNLVDEDNDGKVDAPQGDDAKKLVNAGDITNAINASGFKAKANGDEGELINPGDEVDFINGSNIEITREGGKFTVATKKDVTFDSVTFGDNGPKITNNGGNINVGGPNGEPVKITNVADGDVNADSKDAVNGSQLYTQVMASREEVKSDDKSVTVTTTQNDAGANVYDLSVNVDETTITKTPDGKLTANTTNLVDEDNDGKVDAPQGDDAKKLVNAGDITNAINASGFKAKANGDEGELINPGDEVDFINGSNIEITREGGKFTVATKKDVTFDSVTFGDNGPKITNNGGNINVGGPNGEPVKITNVADGDVNADSKDAVNGSQLYTQVAASKEVVKSDDKSVTVTTTQNDAGANVYDLSVNVDGTTITKGDNGELKANTTTLADADNDGKVDDLADDKKGNLITAGDITNAINASGFKAKANGDEGELINPGDEVDFINGSNIEITREGGKFTVATKKDVTFDSVTFGDNGPKITNNGGNINVGGPNGEPVKITNVADGDVNADSKDAVNGSQLYTQVAASKEVVKSDDKSVTVTTTQNDAGANVYDLSVNVDETTITKTPDGKLTANTTNLVDEDNDGKVDAPQGDDAKKLVNAGDITNAINASGFKAKANGDEGELINPGDEVDFINGSNIEITREGGKFTVATKKDVTFDSVTFGDNGPKITNNGGNINVGGPNGEPVKITNVADGDVNADSKDAVNGSQLYTQVMASREEVKSDDKSVTVTTTQNDAGANVYDLSVNVDETTITKTPDGKLTANTTNLVDEDNDGKVDAPQGDDAKKLVNAGDITNAINASGFKAKANGDEGELINPGDEVDFINGSNIEITREGGKFTVATKKDVTFDSVTFGDNGPKITNNGGNINVGGPNGEPVKITNVADGDVNADSKDAVNGSQLYTQVMASREEVKSDDKSVTVTTTQNADGANVYDLSVNVDGTTITKGDNGELKANTTELKDEDNDGKVDDLADDKKGNLITAGDVATAINASGFKAKANGDEGELINPGDEVEFINGSNIEITREGGKFTVATKKDVTFDSVTFGDNGPKITNNGGNINVGGPNGEPVKITNVANGDVNADSKDAVNGSQLYTQVMASREEVKSDDKSVTVTTTQNADGANVYDLSVNVDGTTITKGDNGELKANTTELKDEDNDGKVDAPQGDDAKKLVNAGDITNAINASGFKAKANGDEGELINPGDEVEFINGSNIEITREGGKFTVATAKDVTFDSVTFGDNGPKITNNGGNINVGDKDGAPVKITNVKAGEDDTDAVNVSQLKAAQNAATTKVEGTQGVTVTPTTNNDGSTTYTVAAKTDGTTVKVDDNGNIAAVTTDLTNADNGKVNTPVAPNALVTAQTVTNAINNAGFNLQVNGDDADLVKTGDTVQFLNGSNIEVTRSGNDITVATKDDVTFNSVTANSLSVGPVTVNNAGINAGNTTITNVAPGVNDTDAVNVSQLKGLAQNVYGDINNLGNRIDDVDRSAKGGIASAMAFEDAPFIPGKWTYAVGAAHFGGEQAVAASLKKTADNGRWAFSGGISTASEGGTGVRIGVSGIID